MSRYALGDPAVTIAGNIADMFRRQETLLRDVDGWSDVQAIAAGNFRRSRMSVSPLLPPRDYDLMLVSSVIEQLWRRTRIIYAIHPDMLTELTGSTSAIMPGEVFRRLPHTNPFVVFPEPLPVVLTDERPGKLHGFYVYGTTGAPGGEKRRFLTTDDPDTTSIGLMFMASVHDDRGNLIDWDTTRISFPVNVERFDVADTVRTVVENYLTSMELAHVPRGPGSLNGWEHCCPWR